MIAQSSTRQVARRRWRLAAPLAAAALAGALVAAAPASGAVVHGTSHGARHGWGHGRPWFQPGNLVVSGSNYVGTASLFTPGVTELPPGCVGSACTPAVADGTYPGVFNNDASDGSFGITSPIFLDQITPDGHLVNVLHVPDGTSSDSTRNHIVTSFSSKSELALHLSTNGQDISFMGYYTQPDAVDVSNSNTPGDVDPTNPVAGAYYRVAAEINKWGKLHYTLTNAYSGNNGRSSILNNSDGNDFYYTAGNAGNAAIRSRWGSSSARARNSSRPPTPPRARNRPASPLRSAALTSPSSATRPTRPGRTPTSAASRSTTTSSTSPRAVAATA
jgi:hypothetical protein